MHYALVFYPVVDGRLIDKLRRRYDPTVDVIEPHVTVLFPVPDRVGEVELVDHIQSVLDGHGPFEVRLGGFRKSSDHWLLLTLREGNQTVKELYRSLYSGILSEFRRDDIEFVPHLGLGLFLKEGARYDPWSPRESDFAAAEYESALQEAKALRVDYSTNVQTLHLVTIPGELMEWITGQRPNFPTNARVEEVRQFHLGSGDA
ncbi:MAG: hypothetical protein GTN78_19790 [Gemmatimonadales bacterium]|nr:hypothetical protein [Gemmatimonadales bacterium]NIN12616.1 hypothetical protein [Gemmatimonadales bacterium]NIR02409.1 hypothetical protein [Gemmatimonadales bacterium]NIS66200.1 hypothetical protein [Gemmatimonadales bacterium]